MYDSFVQAENAVNEFGEMGEGRREGVKKIQKVDGSLSFFCERTRSASFSAPCVSLADQNNTIYLDKLAIQKG